MDTVTIVGRRARRLAAILIVTAVPAGATEPSLPESREEQTAGTGEIVITGCSLTDDGQVALPVTVLSGDALAHRWQGGLSETLAGLPGIHLDISGVAHPDP